MHLSEESNCGLGLRVRGLISSNPCQELLEIKTVQELNQRVLGLISSNSRPRNSTKIGVKSSSQTKKIRAEFRATLFRSCMGIKPVHELNL